MPKRAPESPRVDASIPGDAERETLARAFDVWGLAQSERVIRNGDGSKSISELRWDAAYEVQDTTPARESWPIVDLSACALECWVELERAGEQTGKVRLSCFSTKRNNLRDRASQVRCEVTTFAISDHIVDVTTKSNGSPIFTPWLDGDVVRATFVATLPRTRERVTLAQFACTKPKRFGCFGPNSSEALAPVREFTQCALGGRIVNDEFALLSVGVMGPFEEADMMARSFASNKHDS